MTWPRKNQRAMPSLTLVELCHCAQNMLSAIVITRCISFTSLGEGKAQLFCNSARQSTVKRLEVREIPREFAPCHCAITTDRDVNAALNINGYIHELTGWACFKNQLEMKQSRLLVGLYDDKSFLSSKTVPNKKNMPHAFKKIDHFSTDKKKELQFFSKFYVD